MSIWFHKHITLENLADWSKNTLAEHIGITFTEIGEDSITATLPVDKRTVQPYGWLHGGARLL